MGLFKSAKEKELDSIISRIEMNMQNNYKDNAQDALKDLEETLASLKKDGKLKPVILEKYEHIAATYKDKMKGYSHKDQKPYWT